MIIQRQEKDGIVKGYYKSTNVALSEYNKNTKDLIITFDYGGVYAYHNVPEKDYVRFEMDESQGKILNSHIKQFSFSKLDNVDKDYVKNQIAEAIAADKKSFEVRILEIMGQIKEDYIQNGENGLNTVLMSELDKTITYFNTL